ncbi:MAG TPA: sigma 54-interacting transcriptional regulator [Rubrivivax sp.]|nr:sigma 54-interacting transcriptional regulator [Rubrivivax sp.]
MAINCAALPESLIESELFGYVEGSFTGATKKGKAGLFEMAHGGTICLDEISELPLVLQGRLLRVLQEKQVMRIGDNKLLPVDVRIVCAILGDALEGEARDVGQVLAGIALHAARHGQPFAPPCVLLSGGETTVTVRGGGRGGRNVECLLSFTAATGGHPNIHALMADTDGVDGQEEIAGACIGPDTLPRARAQGLRPLESLADNDGHGFFEALGASLVTGPTMTNVNDFRAVLITGTCA